MSSAADHNPPRRDPTAAERKRRQRARGKAGYRIFPVPVADSDLWTLDEYGMIDLHGDDDLKEKVSAELGRLIRGFAWRIRVTRDSADTD